jgi:hypothetical protein|tara:strand:+ start:906 stop:2375 length:1470 start_codon:yes stop_codon:yes gene_type:complete
MGEMTLAQQQALAKARARLRVAAQNEEVPVAPPQPAAVDQSAMGGILPFSKDAQGNIDYWNTDAGLIGMAKRAVTAGADAMRGEFDPTTDHGRMLEAAAMMSPLSAASKLRMGTGALPTNPGKVPTAAELKAATDAGYKKVDALDIEYKSAAVKELADDLEFVLNEEGFFKTLAPEVHSLIKHLQDPPANSSVRLKAIDAFRRRLGEIAGGPDKTKAAAATKGIKAVDDFLRSPNGEAIVGVPTGGLPAAAGQVDEAATAALAQEAATTIETARGNAAAGFRSDLITKTEDGINLSASAASSGMNFDNAARQRLKGLLINKDGRGLRGFSDAEKLAMRDIIEGTPTKNALRYLGNLFGGGGGLGQMVTTMGAGAAGMAAAGPQGGMAAMTIPALIGWAGKTLSNTLTKAELKSLDKLVRSRSPLAESRAAPGGMPAGPTVPRIHPAMQRPAIAGQMQPPQPIPAPGGLLSQPTPMQQWNPSKPFGGGFI